MTARVSARLRPVETAQPQELLDDHATAMTEHAASG